jgi:uncharacterized membrane protein
MDTRTPDQLAYEQYLSKLPRPERRRILKDHWKRIDHAASERIRARDEERRIAKIKRQMEAKHATA